MDSELRTDAPIRNTYTALRIRPGTHGRLILQATNHLPTRADEDYSKPDCCLADIHCRRVTTATMNTMITTMNISKATGPEMIDVPELPPANHSCAM